MQFVRYRQVIHNKLNLSHEFVTLTGVSMQVCMQESRVQKKWYGAD